MMAAYMLWLVPMEQSMFSYQYASVIASCSFDHVVFQGLLREIKSRAGIKVIPGLRQLAEKARHTSRLFL